MKKNTRLTTRLRVALAQVGLLVSIILTALMLGLVPDPENAIRQGRVILAQAVALNASGMITPREIRRLESNLHVIVKINDDLLSAAVRRSDRFPAVVVVPPFNGCLCLILHATFFLTGSQASSSPPKPPGP